MYKIQSSVSHVTSEMIPTSGQLLRNNSTFLITVTNYSLAVEYQLLDANDDVITQPPPPTMSSLQGLGATAGRFVEYLGIHTVIIAILAAVAVLLVVGHVIVTCRKRSRRQTWSVQSVASTARGRFIQRDVWKGTTGRRPENTHQPAASDPFHTDIYRTLAYAYNNWKQDVRSPPSSSGRSASSISGSIVDKCIGATRDSITSSYSSRTVDDVTLPSSLTDSHDVTFTSTTPDRGQASRNTPMSRAKTAASTPLSIIDTYTTSSVKKPCRPDASPASNCSSILKFPNTFDAEYEARVHYVLGSDAIIDLDSSVGANSDNDPSDIITVTSLDSRTFGSPELKISMDDTLNDF